MSKMQKQRKENLYTVEQDGQPVAQALAISQAEAVALWIASQQQPVLSARLSSPLEARTLAGLPLLTRGETVRDTATPDLFGDVPAAPVSPVVGAVVDPVLLAPMPSPPGELVATPPDNGRYGCDGVYRHPPAVPAQIVAELAPDHVEDILAMVEPLAAGGFAPCGRALGYCGKATQTCGRDGCGVELAEMPPQNAPIAAVLEGPASGDQPGESVAGDCAEPAGTPADASPASADAPTLSERMAGAYAAGAEVARQGHARRSVAAFLDASAVELGGMSINEVGPVYAEMLRGFDDGKAQADQAGTEERRRLFDATPKGAGKVLVKYRNPATGESWSGRGLRPRWLVAAMDEGKALDDFLI